MDSEEGQGVRISEHQTTQCDNWTNFDFELFFFEQYQLATKAKKEKGS